MKQLINVPGVTQIQTRKSLLGMPSKREGLIQPSVTSQPPRLTAFTRTGGFRVLPEENGNIKDKIIQMLESCCSFVE